MSIKIPKKSKIYEYLNGDNRQNNRPAWRRLDALLSVAEQNDEKYVISIYDEFVSRIGVFFPEKIEELNKLRPLIIKHIIRGLPLDESYYKMIREL